MRPWLPALLVIAAAFAGCADEGTPETVTDDPEAHDHGGHDHGNETVHHNTPPVANLTADVLNGTAPLMVNLTLSGSDADGDNLTWSLQVNGTDAANGTQLPATLALNFTAGNHTLLLTISDGNATANATLAIAVAVGVPSGPCGGEEEPCVIDEDAWVLFYSDGTCHMKDEFVQSRAGGIYVNDRHTGQVGTGLASGGGTWVYEEDNGVAGLQVGGAGEAGAYAACFDHDHLIF